jgi:3-phenylpropionate/cinnamic acid dioxygenase small subunit
MTVTTGKSLEDRLDEIESRTSIAALVAGYCEGTDRRDLDLFLSLWHDDAEYLIPGGRGDFSGIDRIRESQTVIARAWKETYHWTTNHTISFESADRANGRSDCYAMCVREDGQVCHVGCTYFDDYERRAGVWKFAKRLVNRWFVSEPVDIKLLPPY